jgi:hypothetical protein
MIAIGRSIRAYVTEILSIPDSGVDIRNALVAPVLAPDFLRVTAVGITEHEQSGSGIPIIAAFNTEPIVLLPSQLLTFEIGRNCLIKPDITSPRTRYGADITVKFQKAVRNIIGAYYLIIVIS